MQQSINLLYPATIAATKAKKGPERFVVILAAVLILACPVLYGYLHYREIDMKAQIARVNSEIAGLTKPLPGEAIRRPLIKERNALTKAIQVITETKNVISKPMDQISLLSDPGVVLTSTEVQTNPSSLIIKGTAPSHSVVSKFMGNIQNSQYFHNSYIKTTIAEVEANRRMVEFSIQIIPSEGVFK